MIYTKGDRVKHPTQEEWGLGEVLEDSKGGIVRIFICRGWGKEIIITACSAN